MSRHHDVLGDLRRYQTGSAEDGNPIFAIPLSPDEDGMIGRECPDEECAPRYFKIMPVDESLGGESEEDARSTAEPEREGLTCPYCGRYGERGSFFTRQQLEMVKSMVSRSAARAVGDMLEDAFRQQPRSSPSGLFSISMSVKRGSLPSIRHYAEEHLKRQVTCDQCHRVYAVYGIAFYCPWCGEGNLIIHLDRSITIIQTLATAGDLVAQAGGEEARHHVLSNCLEDIVSLFEGFLKQIYERALRDRDGQAADQRLAKVRTSFQRLDGAERFFQDDFRVSILGSLNEEEREWLSILFTKRHVIAHSLGLVDPKFQQVAGRWNGIGREVTVTDDEVQRGLLLVRRVVERAADVLPQSDRPTGQP